MCKSFHEILQQFFSTDTLINKFCQITKNPYYDESVFNYSCCCCCWCYRCGLAEKESSENGITKQQTRF